MKKETILVTFLLAFCFIGIKAFATTETIAEGRTVINLRYYANSEQDVLGPIRRTPPQERTIYIYDGTIDFAPFNADGQLEIENVETREVIYSSIISSQDTNCSIPSDIEGEHIIRFVFESCIFYGVYEF